MGWFILLWYVVGMTVLGFAITAYDKLCAVKGWWRIRERTLLLVALLGGAVGVFLAMLVTRHKIRNPSFAIGVPLIIALWLIATYAVWYAI